MSQKKNLSTSKTGKRSGVASQDSANKNTTYKIKLHPAVIHEDSKFFNDKQKEKIKNKCISLLSKHPNEVGEPLQFHLKGYRKLKIFNDYRIVYKVDDNEITVFVIAIGIRREEFVYETAKSRI